MPLSNSISPRRFGVALLCVAIVAFALGRLTAPTPSAPNADRLSQDLHLPPAVPPNSSSRTAAQIEPPVISPLESDNSQPQPIVNGDTLLELDRTAPSERREDERLKLVAAWAATDPLAAIAYAEQHLRLDRLNQAMSGIATEWAKHDPLAAWKWARSSEKNSTQAHTVMEEIGKNDPATAARLAKDYARQQPDDAVAMAMTAMRGMIYQGSLDAARTLATELPLRAPEEQGMLLNFMAGQWARLEPEKAAQWVQALPEGQARDQGLVGLTSSWAEKDPPRAADFAARLPAGQIRQEALRQAIGFWLMSDATLATTWINQFPPHEDFDQAIASVATMRFLVDERVDVALQWAGSITNEGLRAAALSEIVSTWSLRDRTAALKFAQTATGLSTAARDQLVHQLQQSAP